MPPLLTTPQFFQFPHPPTDPVVQITDTDRKAIDLTALKHPITDTAPLVDPLTFASLTLHHVKAIVGTNNLPEEYLIPLYYGHLTAAWTIDGELNAKGEHEAEEVEKQHRTQMFCALKQLSPPMSEVKQVGRYFLKDIEAISRLPPERQKAEFLSNGLNRFPIELLTTNTQNVEIHERNSSPGEGEILTYNIESSYLPQNYIDHVWSSLKTDQIVEYHKIYVTANIHMMKSYFVGSFMTMIFATASENMSSNWYEKRFSTLCSLFPDLFMKVVMSTDIIERYSKLYLRKEIPEESIYTAFRYSSALTKDYITENKLAWIISQVHTHSVRAALGLAELVLTNRFLTHSFLSQHIPEDQFKAIGILVMEIYRDPFASIVISNRKALRYLYPDLAYLGISASSQFSLYPCRPLGTAVNTKETLDRLMAAIKEISMEIESARMMDLSPQIDLDLEHLQHRNANPYQAWEQFIVRNMTPKDHAFVTFMDNLLNTCRAGIIDLIRDGGWDGSAKQTINQDFREKLNLFGIKVPEEYQQPELPAHAWKLSF